MSTFVVGRLVVLSLLVLHMILELYTAAEALEGGDWKRYTLASMFSLLEFAGVLWVLFSVK